MKHLKFFLLISAISIFAFACTDTGHNANDAARAGANNAATPTPPSTPQPTPDELAGARTAYNAACVRCHKENGEGGVAELDEKTKLKVPSFKDGHSLKHTDQEYARQIANGGEGMPAFKKRLSQEQIDQLVRYIRRDLQAGLAYPGASPAH